MSKSSYKPRKRRLEDRLAEIQEKLARLTDIMSKEKVKASCGSSRSPSKSSVLANENDLASDSEYLSEYLPSKKVSRASTSTNGGTLVMPINQERSSDPRVSDEDGKDGKKSSGEASPSPPLPTIETEASDEDTLLKEFFGSDCESESTETIAWNNVVSQKWRDIVRGGLSEDERTILIKKYSSPDEMDFLKAPRRNPECKALKDKSVIKRDEDICANQDQAGVSLYALGEAISDFLRPEIQISLSPEARLAVAKINDGVKILADHFYHLTLFRREQIISICSSEARATADAIPADNFLFGASFGEELRKRTASMNKLSKDIPKSAETVTKRANSPRVAQDFPGCREVIRQAFIFQGTPENALDITIASVTKATMAEYEKPLRLWWYFCESNRNNYFEPTAKSVLEFLVTAFSNGDSYSTLESYCSAISLISKNVCDDFRFRPIIYKFFEGVKVLKPQ